MIDFTKGIFQSDEFLKVLLNGNWCNINEAEYPEEWKQVQDWITAGGIVQPEPLPTPPTPEQLRDAEISSLKAYLDSTDWYVARFAETGTAIPDETKAARATARARIDELRGQV